MNTRSKSPKSVLIVEGDSISRSALEWLLKDLGFAAIAVSNLADARSALQQAVPDILILDLTLPDGDGTDLLRQIRRQRIPMKVAVVTSADDRLNLHDVTAFHPDALFGKPVDLDDFDAWLVKQLSEFALSTRESAAIRRSPGRAKMADALLAS